MAVKVAATSRLQLSRPIHRHPQPPSSSQALASAISSPKCSNSKSVRRLNRSALFSSHFTSIQRSRSFELLNPRSKTLKKACSASLDEFSDEEFSKQIQELAIRFRSSDDSDELTSKNNTNAFDSESETEAVKVTISLSDFERESTRPL